MMNLSYWGLAETATELSAIKEFELKSKIYSIYVGVTTNDHEVMKILRALIEPIIVFGEGKYERRERLKKVLLYKYDRLLLGKDPAVAAASSSEAMNLYEVMNAYNIDMNNVFSKKPKSQEATQTSQQQDSADKELFYTEGGEGLKHLRSEIANISWKRTCIRKEVIHRYRVDTDQYEHKDHVEHYGKYLTDTLSLAYSHVAAGRPLTGVQFSPNSKHFAVTSFQSTVNIYGYNPTENFPLSVVLDNESKEMVHCLDWNYSSNRIYDSKFTPESIDNSKLLLATGHSAGSVTIWRPFSEGKEQEEEHETCVSSVLLHEARVNRIKFHPFKDIVLSASADDTIRLFDLTQLQELYFQEGHSHAVHALAVNGDGNLMASGDMHGVMLLIDLRTGRHIFQQPMHNGKITAIDFHPLNAHIFATAAEDNTVKIFDLRKVRTLTTLLGHTKLVSDLQFEPTYGRYLSTGSFDTHVKVWDTSEYMCRKVLPNNNARVMGLHIAPDSPTIVTACYDRSLRFFKPSVECDSDMVLRLWPEDLELR